ncbi:MAG: YozE family protein [Candidatus Tectimicrobiota bacterium]
MTISFYTWLMRHVGRDSMLGDLARDAQRDRCFPQEIEGVERLHLHLAHHGACEGAYQAARAAWKAYRQYVARHKEKAPA